MNFEFTAFCFFLRNLAIFTMSYLGNQKKFSKTFFTFKFFSDYSFKIANLSWHKSKVIFAVNLMTSFSPPKPLTSKIQKHTIVGNTKFPLKTVNPFQNFHAVLLPPTLCKVETRKGKNFRIHASNIVCGVREGVGPV